MNNGTGAEVGIIDVLVFLSIISLLILPSFILYSEYDKGNVSEYYRVQDVLKEKMDQVYAINFNKLPIGKTENSVIEDENGVKIDLKPFQLDKETVKFAMKIDLVPLEFSAIKNSEKIQLQYAKASEAFKKVELLAKWGKKDKCQLSLLAYRAKL